MRYYLFTFEIMYTLKYNSHATFLNSANLLVGVTEELCILLTFCLVGLPPLSRFADEEQPATNNNLKTVRLYLLPASCWWLLSRS